MTSDIYGRPIQLMYICFARVLMLKCIVFRVLRSINLVRDYSNFSDMDFVIDLRLLSRLSFVFISIPLINLRS